MWHRVVPQLQEPGHLAAAVDLPCADDSAGFHDSVETVPRAAGDREELIPVVQALAGFTTALVCDRQPVDLVALVHAMAPLPGESAGERWANTGHAFPDPFDPVEVTTRQALAVPGRQQPLCIRPTWSGGRRRDDTVRRTITMTRPSRTMVR